MPRPSLLSRPKSPPPRPGLAALTAVTLGLAASALGCEDKQTEGPALDPPGELMAGVARVRMPVPVGIGTVGYGGFGVVAEPSPFAEIYPATTRVHGHPNFKAVVLSRGPGYEVAFLRADTVGIFQQFRRAVVEAVEDTLGRPIDHALVIAGTHTHSGPGRVVDGGGGGVYEMLTDEFWPEFYLEMVAAAAETLVRAYDDLAPARIGHAWAQNRQGHEDRRCDDGMDDYSNDAIPVVAVERDGQIDAVVFAYAMHGTVLGIEDLTLSGEASGAIEAFIEAGFDHPVQALFFNAWGADMAPGNPDVDTQPGAELPGGYLKLLRIGRSVADSVHDALTDVSWEQDPVLFAETHRVALNRQVIGYADDEFEYEFGGVYCGGAGSTDCDASTSEYPYFDDMCVGFPEQFPAPDRTVLSSGQIGSLAFVTFPGEPGTLLAEELLGRLSADHGYDNVMFLGYTQDYNGYSILEDDWWQGGYEAGGSIWGPRQGEYLVDMAEAMFALTMGDGPRISRGALEVDPAPAFAVDSYDPYVPTPGVDVGAIVQDASPLYGLEDVVVLTVQGSDPWNGTPIATLIDEAGEPVLAPNGVPVDSDGFTFWVDLQPDPGYAEARDAPSRRFLWTFSMPVQQRVAGLAPPLTGGSYRLRVVLPTEAAAVEVTSAEFAVP